MSETFRIKFQKGNPVAVMVFSPVERTFDYIANEPLQVGDVVDVPFGNKTRKGVVWGASELDDKLKSVDARLDYPPMRRQMKEFVEVMAAYTITPIGQILPMLYRTSVAIAPKPNALRAVPNFSKKLSPKRQVIYDQLVREGVSPLTNIDASRATIRGMVNERAADWAYLEALPSRPHTSNVNLTHEQNTALKKMRESTKPIVLKGVTGSGKTEVYLELVADALNKNAQALVLLPEIALTAAFLERFEKRFGFSAGHWHSNMSVRDRRRIWHGVASGQIQAVIGARSALFLPFNNLQVIVVDEEHDKGYKQEEGVIYSGRDMAVLRAHYEGAKIVLTSATPSIETMQNVRSGRYLQVNLIERFGKAELPDIRVIDMRGAGLVAGQWISPFLFDAMKRRMEKGEQSLLFLNRRGFAPLTLCRACGHQLACPNCDARLVEHRFRQGLNCHQCGFQMAIPKNCPNCHAEEKLVPLGPGVERIAEEVNKTLQHARVCVLSSDTASNEVSLRSELKSIERGQYDIVIGTQMVAKGHNFPALTLVGIIDADIGLEGADLRASESSFQVLRQVSGRAGRFDTPGLALVQSYQPDHPILRAILCADDRLFYDQEISRREYANAPPFSRYIALVISADEAEEAMQAGRELLKRSTHLHQKGVQIWGPAIAPIARIRNRARIRMLLKLPKSLALHQDVHDWVKGLKFSSRVKIHIDVDPQSFI